jgi:hypothetical protein
MKKQVMNLAIVTMFLVGFVCLALKPTVFALHTSEVQWAENACSQPFVVGDKLLPGGDTKNHLMTQAWQGTIGPPLEPERMTFRVAKLTGDVITKVEVFIPQDDAGHPHFHFVEGFVWSEEEEAPFWTTTIVEVDSLGWPRIVMFETSDETYAIGGFLYSFLHFDLKFAEGPVECDYDFTITTIDTAGKSVFKILQCTLDNTPAKLTESYPAKSTPPPEIPGIGAICGNHYFLLDVKVQDGPEPHDTGLYSVRIWIDDGEWVGGSFDKTYDLSYLVGVEGAKWKLSDHVTQDERKVWLLADGSHHMYVTIEDGVENSVTVDIPFTYKRPPRPLVADKTSGYAALVTKIKDPKTGLIESEHMVYTPSGKEFGTTVTLNGISVGDLQWGANIDVYITIHLETYTWYYYTYGTYDVLVAKVKTDSKGAFAATFNFPKAPMGKYRISATTHPAPETTMYCFFDYFEVKPQIIYKPHEVIGPALINVEATGFPSVASEGPATTMLYVFCNNKDVLQGVNDQVWRNWFIDGNGTLQNAFTYYNNRFTENGLYWPIMQPGDYDVTLFVDGTMAPMYSWNIDHWVALEGNFEHGNTISVLDTLSLLPDIESKLDYLKPIIERIDQNVVTIKTDVGIIKADIKSIIQDITIIKSNVAEIKTTVGTILGYVDDINWNDIITIKTTVGNIWAKIQNIDFTAMADGIVTIKTDVGIIKGKVQNIDFTAMADGIVTIKTDVGIIKGKVENIDFSTMADGVVTIKTDVGTIKTDVGDILVPASNVSALSIPISAVLSAIAAIASITAVVVVMRRLKVAA